MWNEPERLKNIIIHLNDFHCMKEIFTVMGKLISGSGFEEIIFQSGLCSSESSSGVVSGSHYNRCWTVHTHLAEALERLQFERFSQLLMRLQRYLQRSVDLLMSRGVLRLSLRNQLDKNCIVSIYSLRKEYTMEDMGKRASFGWFTIMTSCEFSI